MEIDHPRQRLRRRWTMGVRWHLTRGWLQEHGNQKNKRREIPPIVITLDGHRLLSLYRNGSVAHYPCTNTSGVWGQRPHDARLLFTRQMQRFFPDFESLDHFTLSLSCLDETVQCPHCEKSHHLISHGVIYKQRTIDMREQVGKRLFCSNRHQHAGCGRTVPLYVATVLPTMQYAVATVFVFLSALLANVSVCAAYQTATGQSDARHAWRWLNKLTGRLSDLRVFVHARREHLLTTGNARCRRLRLLLPTLASLFAAQPSNPVAHYQLMCQQPLF